MPALYYISDNAYDNLIAMSKRAGFTPSYAKIAKGMAEFIAYMSKYKFSDNRPPFVKEEHEQCIKYNRAPLWVSHQARRTRCLQLDEKTIENLVRIAYDVGIIRRDQPWIVGGPSRIKPTPIVGYVLEAMGLEWILPYGS